MYSIEKFLRGLADFEKKQSLRRGFHFFLTPVPQAKKNYM